MHPVKNGGITRAHRTWLDFGRIRVGCRRQRGRGPVHFAGNERAFLFDKKGLNSEIAHKFDSALQCRYGLMFMSARVAARLPATYHCLWCATPSGPACPVPPERPKDHQRLPSPLPDQCARLCCLIAPPTDQRACEGLLDAAARLSGAAREPTGSLPRTENVRTCLPVPQRSGAARPR